MKNIKNIVIDLGVVLINLNRPECMRAFKELGLYNIEEMTSLAIHKGIFADFELGNTNKEGFFNSVRQLTDKNISNEDINRAWLMMIEDIPQYKLDLIISLKKNYNVFLLSNTNEIHWEYCRDNIFCTKGRKLSDYFDKVFLSYEMHKLKPEEDIFYQLIKECDINPSESILIDDAEQNCLSAKKLGFKTYAPAANEDWSYVVNFENKLD